MRGKKAGAEGWRVLVDIVTPQLCLPCSPLSGSAAPAPPGLARRGSPSRRLRAPRPDALTSRSPLTPPSRGFSPGQRGSRSQSSEGRAPAPPSSPSSPGGRSTAGRRGEGRERSSPGLRWDCRGATPGSVARARGAFPP